MEKFPISLASYSFHGLAGAKMLDVFSYINLLSDHYRVRYADIWTGLLPTLDEGFLKQVRGAMDDRGITLANLCVDGPHLWVDDESERAEHKSKMLEYIRAAEILGAKTIRVDFGGKEDVPMPGEAFEYIVKTYREYCDLTAAFGAKIGPENHWGWDRVPENLLKVREAVDRKNYGHLFHFTNFYNNETAKGSEIAISYAMHTHIPANSLPVAKDLIRRLAASGYEGTFSVEHHSGHLEIPRVEWQLGAVRNFVAELSEEGLDAPAKPDYFSELNK